MAAFKPIEAATNQDIRIELREVYIIRGANKAYLSESGALNKLAYIRAQEQYNEERRESNFPSKKVKQKDGTTKLRRGDMRPEFIRRHAQLLEEMKADIRREREKIALRKKYSKAMHEMDLLDAEIAILEIQIAELE
ncbi:hypothetical protein ABLB69_02565 [Xenorhabdus khoisanae]|uniref:hypothetical protein n=1 Tax=Xenorhabdus khoisanae TaxID=880157 RepID=UPI0032B8201D